MKFDSFRRLSQRGQFFILGCLGCLSCLFISCSEEDNTVDEYANWPARNDQYLAAIVNDSLRQPGWHRYKKYSLNDDSEGAVSEYVYVKVLEDGDGQDTPMFTDSVRISYQGRLIPTPQHPEGYVFDSTIYGTYDKATNSNTKFLLSATTLIDGFSTVLQRMHRGDHWRVYIPSELGYKESTSSTIPAHSLLIFDITLIDFSPTGQVMPVWNSRRSER